MSNVILEIKDLCKQYPEFELQNFNLNLYEGEIVGFIGPNGSGKSTTIKAILNLVRPDQGQLLYYGKSIKEDEQRIKREIGYVGEHLNYYEKTTLQKIYQFTKCFYKAWDDDLFKELLHRFNLSLSKKIAECSKGMLVKFSIALSLAHHPKLLILDEPTSGLDPLVRNDVLNILKEISQRDQTTVFFSSHITEDIEKIADRVVTIYNGRQMTTHRMEDLVNQSESLNDVLLGLIETAKGGSAC